MNNTYVLITWPESQEFMEEHWFKDEAILHCESSADYFIPLLRVEEFDHRKEVSNGIL